MIDYTHSKKSLTLKFNFEMEEDIRRPTVIESNKDICYMRRGEMFKYPYYEVLREDVELPTLYHDSYTESHKES